MTSGEFHTVPIDSIIINREGRQRRELKDIPNLADSIHRLGLIHPPVVKRNLELVSGERRVAACKLLGWTHIRVQYVDEVPKHVLDAIELEENIKRNELPWDDQCRTVFNYFKDRKAVVEGFTQTDLGEELGLSQQYISRILLVAQEMPNNGRILDADNLAAAHRIAVREVDRRRATVQLRTLRLSIWERGRFF
jgi:ParB/RepB/Spo0J family partition protein